MNKKIMIFLISLALSGMVIGMNGSKPLQEVIIKAMYARFVENPVITRLRQESIKVGLLTTDRNNDYGPVLSSEAIHNTKKDISPLNCQAYVQAQVNSYKPQYYIVANIATCFGRMGIGWYGLKLYQDPCYFNGPLIKGTVFFTLAGLAAECCDRLQVRRIVEECRYPYLQFTSLKSQSEHSK